MDISRFTRNSCRLCLTESDFNVSLFGTYARKTHIVEKILATMKIVIEDTDPLTTICYKCAGNVERYYDFITVIKKSQNRLNCNQRERNLGLLDESINRRRVSYVREELEASDFTFSFLEIPEEKREKSSSPLFSYISPQKPLVKKETDVWKTPREVGQNKRFECEDKSCEKKRQRNCSRDMFETQSQEEEQPKGFDWKLTPDDNIIKRVRAKFGWS